MRIIKSYIILTILLSAFLFSSINISAEETGESAEINARVDGEIPSIKILEWTPVNIVITDGFGIDWDKLTQLLPEWYMRLIWPLNPAFPQPVERFLGYTNLQLSIPQNELPDGWVARVIPSFINQTNPGYKWSVTLEVQVDDSAVDSSVIIPIKVTRIDTLGGEIGSSIIEIPLKPAPTNFITPLKADITQKEAGLKTMVYFDLNIINEGYYKDVFQFEVEAEKGFLAMIDQQALTLEPDETAKITLSILTPEKFFDPGTPSNIKIYVYSSGNATKKLISTVTVITRGIYISPLVIIIAAPIIFIILIFYFLFIRLRDRKIIEKFGKIDKPWNIPIEQKYLKELKEKNKEEYVKIIDMMKDEYKSSLLWYKDYIKHEKNEKSNKSNSTELIRNFFNNQKNNIKKIGKQKEKKEKDESKVKKTEEEQNKKQKNQYKKLFSNIPKRLRLKKEKKQIDQNIIEDEINEKPKTQTEKIQKNNEMDKTEEEKKIEKLKYLEMKKNKEKEKAITKIKKLQYRQRKKIEK